jgi:hypothetical protein
MTIKEFLKEKDLLCVVQGKDLSERIVAALGNCPMWEDVDVFKDEIGEEWNDLAATEHCRMLVDSCKKDSSYVLLYCDVAEYRCDDSESPVSVAKLREFLSCFTCFEWDSSSWISKQPEFYSERIVTVFPNGVVEYSAKETNESSKHFMLIPGEVWDGIDYE